MKSSTILAAVIVTLLPFISMAQTTPPQPPTPIAAPTPPKSPNRDILKINLNEDGSRFFQANFLNQTWLRWDQSNPGTTVMARPADNTFDIGLRRTRIQMYGQITDRAFIYFQFGQNNFNFLAQNSGNRKVAAFFHDALGEYRVTKSNALKLGAGLTIANGLSRFTQPSVSSIMTMDVPVFAQATVDQTDQFDRKLSVFARGQIGKLDYRVVLSDPFPITTNGAAQPPISQNATFAQQGHTKQAQTYLQWQFLEKEGHTTPYMTGTYLGKKKIFNIAAGAIYQPDAMWHLTAAGDTAFKPLFLASGEAYLDMPLNTAKGTAISAYAGYFHTDYGPNYLRYNGLMNPANGTTATNTIGGAGGTFGNAYPMFGTGSVIYAQAGYLFPANMLGEGRGTLMPYASWTHADYDRLEGNSTDVMNLGLNWLLDGHRSKLTLDYQNRPTYQTTTSGGITTGPRRSNVTLQYQVFI